MGAWNIGAPVNSYFWLPNYTISSIGTRDLVRDKEFPSRFCLHQFPLFELPHQTNCFPFSTKWFVCFHRYQDSAEFNITRVYCRSSKINKFNDGSSVSLESFVTKKDAPSWITDANCMASGVRILCSARSLAACSATDSEMPTVLKLTELSKISRYSLAKSVLFCLNGWTRTSNNVTVEVITLK